MTDNTKEGAMKYLVISFAVFISIITVAFFCYFGYRVSYNLYSQHTIQTEKENMYLRQELNYEKSKHKMFICQYCRRQNSN